MLNLVAITGRLVHTPEAKESKNGGKAMRLRIASDRDVAGNDGIKSDFYDAFAFGKTAEFIEKYFDKGRLITLVGRLRTRPYDDRDGNRRTATEIVVDRAYFADSKKEEKREPFLSEPPKPIKPETLEYGNRIVEALKGEGIKPVEVEDEDLPF